MTPPSHFAIPSGTARSVLAELDTAGMGLARARLAARLGDPDPFHVRRWLTTLHPDASVAGHAGRPVTPGALDAALVRAHLAAMQLHDQGAEEGGPSSATPPPPGLAGLFAWSPPGPEVRSVPVPVTGTDGTGAPADAGRLAWLRWPDAELPPAPDLRDARVDVWTTDALGDTPVATVRCILPLGTDDDVALGSDYGLTLVRGGAFRPFPWPAGARREGRRVEAMAVHAGRLHVATSVARASWDLRGNGTVAVQRHPADAEEGFDELQALLAVEGRLVEGWRTRTVGAAGPRDVLSLATTPGGVVYAGTRQGGIHVLDLSGFAATWPSEPVRVFADHKPRPIRHLAHAGGALWVAALGALHRFDGASWSTVAGASEPTALAVDAQGRLWALAEGALHVVTGTGTRARMRRVALPLERPWSLGATREALWIGGRERVWRVALPK